jgi:predicted AlkP superfamily pyrophosphatase or phosphodiesterase
MRRPTAFLLLPFLSAALLAQAPAQNTAPKKPKLVLAIVVDQFRYDYLSRFRAGYTSGFKRLLEQGAVFENAHYIHALTVTAIGHSTFLSGATPNISGIVGNEWFDRSTGKTVTSVSDPNSKTVGGSEGPGSSPHRLLTSTLGDEIKMHGEKSKVIGISIKDRSAILPAGHMADGAYWFEDKSKHWVTSNYYMTALPKWVEDVNTAGPDAKARGAQWMALDAKPGDKPFCTMVAGGADGVRYCGSLEASPWGNEMIGEMAEKALVAEDLGKHEGTDVLAVSYSSNDYVGHARGPDSPEARDISIRTDRLLGKLLEAAEKQAGAGNVLVVLTADHGVAPVPEVNTARRMPGGRLSAAQVNTAMQSALEMKYGAGKWIDDNTGSPYFNKDLLLKYKLTSAEVENTAAEAVRAIPHIYRVYTANQILTGAMQNDTISASVTNNYFRGRSGDLIILGDEYYQFGTSGTTHGTPFNYDTHVPVIFMGAGIKKGHYYQRIAPNDIAPTLAAIVGVQEPSGSVGRVLQELWQ